MSKNDPAFPAPNLFDPDRPGLSKLEWFAGMALQSIKVEPYSAKAMAYVAFELAEAMIAESEKRK